ncbi:hypothetical protein DPMN_086715 [Dreissena polymorpha]|uniref:Uncharacterized protein n=1 Tax=Dreissena polymorpha TaxID=45954 RepID=A0A9D4QVQ8_DREPO|nr:hypothetical protein DPMN_086715 [Dreissena polymorpha]
MGKGTTLRITYHSLLVRAQSVYVSARDISVTLDTFEWSPGQKFSFQLVHVLGLLLIDACTTLTDYWTLCRLSTQDDPSRPESTQDDPRRPKSTQVNSIDYLIKRLRKAPGKAVCRNIPLVFGATVYIPKKHEHVTLYTTDHSCLQYKEVKPQLLEDVAI